MVLIFRNNSNNILKIIDTRKVDHKFYMKFFFFSNVGHLFFGKYCVSIFKNEQDFLSTENFMNSLNEILEEKTNTDEIFVVRPYVFKVFPLHETRKGLELFCKNNVLEKLKKTFPESKFVVRESVHLIVIKYPEDVECYCSIL